MADGGSTKPQQATSESNRDLGVPTSSRVTLHDSIYMDSNDLSIIACKTHSTRHPSQPHGEQNRFSKSRQSTLGSRHERTKGKQQRRMRGISCKYRGAWMSITKITTPGRQSCRHLRSRLIPTTTYSVHRLSPARKTHRRSEQFPHRHCKAESI